MIEKIPGARATKISAFPIVFSILQAMWEERIIRAVVY